MSTSLVYGLPWVSVGAFQSPRRRPTTLSSVSFPLRTHASRWSEFSYKTDFLLSKKNLQDLTGKYADVLESLSPQVRNQIETLRELQRCNIVNGVVEVGKGVADFWLAELKNKYPNGVVVVDKGVPDFWLTALKNNKVTAKAISERDEGALKFLKDIKYWPIRNPTGFKLDFFFDTNPYFKNSVLTKIYCIIIIEEDRGLRRAIGTEIEWHAGKCLTHKILEKTPKNEQRESFFNFSFFNFFSPPQHPDCGDYIDRDDWPLIVLEEQWRQVIRRRNLKEQDFDIGVAIAKITAHAVSWYTGEAPEDEFGGMEDDEGDSLDEEEEDDDEDEEDEDEEEDEEDEDEDEDEDEEDEDDDEDEDEDEEDEDEDDDEGEDEDEDDDEEEEQRKSRKKVWF